MTPFRLAACRQQKQHLIVWCGMALCCLRVYDGDVRDPLAPWRRGVFK